MSIYLRAHRDDASTKADPRLPVKSTLAAGMDATGSVANSVIANRAGESQSVFLASASICKSNGVFEKMAACLEGRWRVSRGCKRIVAAAIRAIGGERALIQMESVNVRHRDKLAGE